MILPHVSSSLVVFLVLGPRALAYSKKMNNVLLCSFAVLAMIHGVTEKVLTLFTDGGVSVLTLAVITSLADEATTKLFY